MMTERKTPSLNGQSGGQGAVINALRKLYDPVLEEPVPDFLIRVASMSREEAAAAVAARDAANGEDDKDKA
ncbi:MAG: hypothetical protein ACK4NA_12920 [Alphaproteobacteria bacterium]